MAGDLVLIVGSAASVFGALALWAFAQWILGLRRHNPARKDRGAQTQRWLHFLLAIGAATRSAGFVAEIFITQHSTGMPTLLSKTAQWTLCLARTGPGLFYIALFSLIFFFWVTLFGGSALLSSKNVLIVFVVNNSIVCTAYIAAAAYTFASVHPGYFAMSVQYLLGVVELLLWCASLWFAYRYATVYKKHLFAELDPDPTQVTLRVAVNRRATAMFFGSTLFFVIRGFIDMLCATQTLQTFMGYPMLEDDQSELSWKYSHLFDIVLFGLTELVPSALILWSTHLPWCMSNEVPMHDSADSDDSRSDSNVLDADFVTAHGGFDFPVAPHNYSSTMTPPNISRLAERQQTYGTASGGSGSGSGFTTAALHSSSSRLIGGRMTDTARQQFGGQFQSQYSNFGDYGTLSTPLSSSPVI